jgi:hypothetical protein
MKLLKYSFITNLVIISIILSYSANSEVIFNNENSEKVTSKATIFDLVINIEKYYNFTTIRTYHFPVNFKYQHTSSLKFVNAKSGNQIHVNLKYYNKHYLISNENILIEPGEYKLIHQDNQT